MAILPPSSDFTGGSVTEGQFKTALSTMRDFLSGLLGADGAVATALATLGALGAAYAAKTAAYTVVLADRGRVLDCTGTWTLALPAAATAGAGFSVIVRVESGVITIDPSGAELVAGAATSAVSAEQAVLLICTGTAWLRMDLPRAQTSAVDTTLNRLMGVGAFGLGSNAATLVTDYDAIMITGFYRNTAAATGTPIAASLSWSVLHVAHASDGTASQLAMRSSNTTANQIYIRRKSGGAWSAWAKLFHGENLLGTVSQSAGLPTGAVIERGSNANGEYVRFADGTQICHATFSAFVTDVTTVSGALYTNAAEVSWTFPAAFITQAGLFVSASPRSTAIVFAKVRNTGSASAALRLLATTSLTATITIDFMAIGRWF